MLDWCLPKWIVAPIITRMLFLTPLNAIFLYRFSSLSAPLRPLYDFARCSGCHFPPCPPTLGILGSTATSVCGFRSPCQRPGLSPIFFLFPPLERDSQPQCRVMPPSLPLRFPSTSIVPGGTSPFSNSVKMFLSQLDRRWPKHVMDPALLSAPLFSPP